jgi:hypothetical protein
MSVATEITSPKDLALVRGWRYANMSVATEITSPKDLALVRGWR